MFTAVLFYELPTDYTLITFCYSYKSKAKDLYVMIVLSSMLQTVSSTGFFFFSEQHNISLLRIILSKGRPITIVSPVSIYTALLVSFLYFELIIPKKVARVFNAYLHISFKI